LGGARPKAFLTSDNKKFIAKLSMSPDIYNVNVVKAEYVAMRLASLAGLNVSMVQMETALGNDVLQVLRFDREHLKSGWSRKAFVSPLMMFELDEKMARRASYELLTEIIRRRFQKNLEKTFANLSGGLPLISCAETPRSTHPCRSLG
jgi:serine/threonine-protein kinase HipA